jgi:hypothetical protein
MSLLTESTPILVDAVADHKRRIAESAIRKPTDTVVFVEGKLDLIFFKKYISAPNLTFKNIGKKKGKTEICDIVSESEDYYGIVDMDYDFNSKMIQHSRLVDTNQQCCLYGYLTQDSGSRELAKLAQEVVRFVCNRIKEPMLLMIREDLINRLKYSDKKIEKFVLERTKAILYRGYLGNKEIKVSSTEEECSWNDVENINGNPTRGLITDSMSSGYENFKKRYSTQLSTVGINDHTISYMLELLFKSQYPMYHKYEIPIKDHIHQRLNKLIIQRGSSEKAGYFLKKMKLV